MMLTSRFPTNAIVIQVLVLMFQLQTAQAQDAGTGIEYIGPNRLVSLNVPKAPNWAGAPYQVTPLDTQGDHRYDKVMLHADDFGQYLLVGVRILPSPSVAEMDKDEPRQVLKNLSEATLMGWRTDLASRPDIGQESFRDSKHGEAIIRVYRAKKGSILFKAQGRQPTRDDAFDTNIASVVARRGAIVVFVLAQNDSSPDDPQNVVKMATALFDELRVTSVP
jgi:hypothetical protein